MKEEQRVHLIKMTSHPENRSMYTKPQDPKRIIIHSMGEFIDQDGDGQDDYFAKDWLDHLNFAAHYFVTPSGVVIHSLPPIVMGAHALNHNVDTIGIEVLVPGAHNYVTFLKTIKNPYVSEKQMDSLTQLVEYLINKYHINKKNVVRHSDIDPDRKEDPGDGFPFEDFIKSL